MDKPFYIDEDECIGDGSCADICPDCFVLDEGRGVAKVIGFTCDEELVEEAMETCPAQCIHWGSHED